MTLLPLFLDLKNRPVLLVGAGRVAQDKVRALASTGCALRVVAKAIPEAFWREVVGLDVQWREGLFREEDLEGAVLVIAATNHAASNHRIATAARAKGILVNAVDDPPACDAYFAATLRRGPLIFAIGTQGSFPGLARAARRLLEALLPEGDTPLLQRLAQARTRCRTLPDPETRKAALEPLLTAFEATFPGVTRDSDH